MTILNAIIIGVSTGTSFGLMYTLCQLVCGVRQGYLAQAETARTVKTLADEIYSKLMVVSPTFLVSTVRGVAISLASIADSLERPYRTK